MSGLASLVGVIYRLVGMCSGAWRIMPFLLGMKTVFTLTVCDLHKGDVAHQN